MRIDDDADNDDDSAIIVVTSDPRSNPIQKLPLRNRKLDNKI